jgi:hypothetical protein
MCRRGRRADWRDREGGQRTLNSTGWSGVVGKVPLIEANGQVDVGRRSRSVPSASRRRWPAVSLTFDRDKWLDPIAKDRGDHAPPHRRPTPPHVRAIKTNAVNNPCGRLAPSHFGGVGSGLPLTGDRVF